VLVITINTKIEKILDFKLSPCFEYCVCSFGYFPGFRLWFADVSKPSVRSIFKGWMWNVCVSTSCVWRWTWQRVSKRRQTTIWRRGNTQKNIYKREDVSLMWLYFCIYGVIHPRWVVGNIYIYIYILGNFYIYIYIFPRIHSHTVPHIIRWGEAFRIIARKHRTLSCKNHSIKSYDRGNCSPTFYSAVPQRESLMMAWWKVSRLIYISWYVWVTFRKYLV
jgi:hypothetical protein